MLDFWKKNKNVEGKKCQIHENLAVFHFDIRGKNARQFA
jgi:hypothetical protein